MSEAEITSLLWWGLSGLFILLPLLFCGPLLDRAGDPPGFSKEERVDGRDGHA
jgi:hypothetical protein